MALGAPPEAASVDRLNGRDWRLIGIAIAVALVSLWVARRYFHRAFPEASIDFQVSGAGSQPIAQRFLQARGWSVAGYMHAEQFGYDDNAKTFLERELGLERSSALLGPKLHLWRWQNRWFKPLTQEQFAVSVSTRGEIVGFSHIIADAAPGASLTEAQARTRAEQFLADVMHLPWWQWTAIGVDREVRAHRTDYIFTWKDTAPLVPGAVGVLAQAEQRHVVRVQGANVGAYSDYLKVPDQWQRSYGELRSRNQTTGLVDTGLMLVVFVALLFVLVMRIRRGDIRWGLALWVGAAGAVLELLAALNSFGAERFAYNTTQSWSAFVAGIVLNDVASAVGVAVLFIVLTAAAESLYRERFPGHTAVDKYLSWRGVRSKSFFLSMVLGLALAALFFAYQTIFYMVANHFGAWAPADVPYDQLLNTRLPWAFVLFSGFFPAISEEFGFRMFAIPLFEKWFRWLWVAVIAASFLWGFGHATYPNQPFYIRGIEVGTGGLLLSWIMIRYGILATVVWHYTVDALYTAMLLLGAHNAYLRWSGAASAFLAVLPLLIALAAYVYGHGFTPAAGLTNAAEGSAPPLPAAPVETAAPLAACQPISGPNWTIGLVVAGALLSAFAVPTAHWGRALPWRLGRGQAIAAAQSFLEKQGYATAGYRAVATLETAIQAGHGGENQTAAADIFAQRGGPALLGAFSGPMPTVVAASWHVRFYRILDAEEFNLAVRPDAGQVIAFAHTLPETAPGGAPALASGQRIAATFLAAQGLNVSRMALKAAQQQVMPARRDSTYVWEATTADNALARPNPLPGEVAYRIEADLAGNRVSYFAAWYHVPEARLRAYVQGTLAKTLLSVAKGLLYAAAALLVFGLFFRFARRRSLAWDTLLKISAAAGIIMIVVSANAWPAAAANYATDTPWTSLLFSTGFGWLTAGLGGFLGTLVLLAPLAITAPNVTALTLANARRQLERESAWDALWVGVLSLAWMLGWAQVRTVVNEHWHSTGFAFFPQLPAGLAYAVPGLSDALAAPLHALWIAAFLGILLPVLWYGWTGAHSDPRLRRQDRGWCLAGILLIWLGTMPAVHSPGQFAQAAIFSGLGLLLLFSFAYLFLCSSPLAYFSAALVPSLVMPALAWLAIPAPGALPAGLVLIGLAAGWLVWLAWVARGRTGNRPAAA